MSILWAFALLGVGFLAASHLPLKEDPIITRLKTEVSKVYPPIRWVKILEGKKSYTQDKEKIFLQLNDERGNPLPFNRLVYILLHELAHLISREEDSSHTSEEFRSNFSLLLNRAIEKGVYTPPKLR